VCNTVSWLASIKISCMCFHGKWQVLPATEELL